MHNILNINNLIVDYDNSIGKEKRIIRAVNDVSFEINRGEIIGIIGESGSGKTTLAAALLGLVQSPGKIISGNVTYNDVEGNNVNLTELTQDELAVYRWTKIACVFQAAQNALNPVFKVRQHFLDTYQAHGGPMGKEEVFKAAGELLRNVKLNEYILDYYPYQLSGGMKQRVLIALSLLLSPDIIVLDEPTTALDVITQKFIMSLLEDLHDKLGRTMVFLTHDISIIGSMVDRFAVMYAGQIVEYGRKKSILEAPRHPYTYGLINAIPTLYEEMKKREAIPGSPPDMLKLPAGCAFQERCFLFNKGVCDGGEDKCNELLDCGDGQFSRCRYWRELA